MMDHGRVEWSETDLLPCPSEHMIMLHECTAAKKDNVRETDH